MYCLYFYLFLIEIPVSKQCRLISDSYEPPHDKPTKWHVRSAKTQFSLGIRPVWSESSLCAQWVAKDLSFLHADSEDSGQTGRMPKLIRVFAGRTCYFVGFVTRRLISDARFIMGAGSCISLYISYGNPCELPHDKTNKMSVRPAKTRISLGIRPVWSESSLSAWRKFGTLATHWAHSEDSDQTWSLCWFCHVGAHVFDRFVPRVETFRTQGLVVRTLI